MAAKSLDILAGKLAFLIQKDITSSSGVLRLAAKECIPGKTFEALSVNEIKGVLERGLPIKLDALRIRNSSGIVSEMLVFLKRNEVEIRGY